MQTGESLLIKQGLKNCSKPNFKVEPQEYFLEYLKGDDSGLLKKFVYDFSNDLEIPSAIIAVGSSVFPKPTCKYHKKVKGDDILIKIIMI